MIPRRKTIAFNQKIINMEQSVYEKSIKKWIKWVVVLLALRRGRPIQWSSFLALNPAIKKALNDVGRLRQPEPGEPGEGGETRELRAETREAWVSQLSNLVSAGLLFSAIADNSNIPSDYGVIYIFSSYIAELNPPSHSQILVTPHVSNWFKISYYKSTWLRKLYNNKQLVIFPLIFGQILSNYLTPTKFKLNQRYLSSTIKTRILNPIWINYSLSQNTLAINWVNLFKNYLLHNVTFLAIYGLVNFKSRVLDNYYKIKFKLNTSNYSQIIKNYLLLIFHKANSLTNFIYLLNLFPIFMLYLTSPLIKIGSKNYFKLYMKLIGFISGILTMFINRAELIPAFGYETTEADDLTESENIRRISDTFLNGLSLYLLKLFFLQKWRILKENHPIFTKMKLKNWNRLEALVLCLGIFKLMNLNDFLKRTSGKDYGIRQNSMIRLVDRVM